MTSRVEVLRDYMHSKAHLTEQPFLEKLRDIISITFTPPVKLRPDQFADQNRILPSHNKSHGQWQTRRYRVAQGVMAAMTEQNVGIITGVACTQILKTSSIEVGILYFAIADPSPMIFGSSTEDLVDKMSKTKFQPMFENLDKGKWPGRIREKLVKFFSGPGWFLHMGMARSVSSFAGLTVRVSFADEIDKEEWDEIEGHGNPLDNFEARGTAFGRKQLRVRMSSPTVESGRIWQSYLSSDQRKAFVTCPHCKESHVLRWKQWRHDEKHVRPYDQVVHEPNREYSIRPELDKEGVQVIDDAGMAVHHYHCPYCQEPWSDNDRVLALQTIVWRQTAPFTCHGQEQHPEQTRSWKHVVAEDGYTVGYATCHVCQKRRVPSYHAGFHAGRLYDPEATHTGIMERFKSLSKTRQGLQSFVNNDLAEPFVEGRFARVSVEEAIQRVEQFDAPMPRRAVLITVGVDVQGQVNHDTGEVNATARLAYEIVAWGRGGESWSLEYDEIPGDPRMSAVWEKLNVRILRAFPRANGDKCFAKAVCVDLGGGFAEAGQRYCNRMGAGFFPINGKPETGNREQAPIWPTTAKPGQARYEVGTNTAKDEIAQSLQVSRNGAGYFHVDRSRVLNDDGTQNEAGHKWFEMLLSEEKTRSRGDRYRRWRKRVKGSSNEGLDCRVYALAGLRAIEKSDGITLEEFATMRQIPEDILPTEGKFDSSVSAFRRSFAEDPVDVVSVPARTAPGPAPLPFIAAKRPVSRRGNRPR